MELNPPELSEALTLQQELEAKSSSLDALNALKNAEDPSLADIRSQLSKARATGLSDSELQEYIDLEANIAQADSHKSALKSATEAQDVNKLQAAVDSAAAFFTAAAPDELVQAKSALTRLIAKDSATKKLIDATASKDVDELTSALDEASSLGINGEAVDGMDVVAVKIAGEKAADYCRAGKGPYILEIKTYRYRGHSMSDPAKYRTREEVQKMRAQRDPIEAVRTLLISEKHATDEEIKTIDKEIKEIINACAEYAKDSPEVSAEELWTDIYA